eukprot:133998-Rhodomonas_salina.3
MVRESVDCLELQITQSRRSEFGAECARGVRDLSVARARSTKPSFQRTPVQRTHQPRTSKPMTPIPMMPKPKIYCRWAKEIGAPTRPVSTASTEETSTSQLSIAHFTRLQGKNLTLACKANIPRLSAARHECTAHVSRDERVATRGTAAVSWRYGSRIRGKQIWNSMKPSLMFPAYSSLRRFGWPCSAVAIAAVPPARRATWLSTKLRTAHAWSDRGHATSFAGDEVVAEVEQLERLARAQCRRDFHRA